MGCEAHLHALLSHSAPTHLFCVDPPPGEAPLDPDPDSSPVIQAAGQRDDPASMLWAYQAHALAGARCKASLVTRGQAPVHPDNQAAQPAGGDGGADPAAAPPSLAPPLAQQRAKGSLALGLSKTLFLEDRAACGPTLDLSPEPGDPQLTAAELAWVVQESGEYSCAARGGHLYVERLVPTWARPRRRRVRVRRGGTSQQRLPFCRGRVFGRAGVWRLGRMCLTSAFKRRDAHQ